MPIPLTPAFTAQGARALAALLIGLALTGCMTVSERDRELSKAIEDTLEEAATAPAILSPAPPPVEEKREKEERFDITVESAPARQFLLSLVQGTDTNMVVHPNVNASVSLELKNVTVGEVLEVVRELYGLEFRLTRSGYIVRAPSLENRVYEVNYLDISRKGSSRTRVSSGQSTENPAALDDSLLTGVPRSGRRGTAGTDDKEHVATGTRIETRSDSEFWQEIRGTLTSILQDSEGRHIMINPQAGIISVRAMPDEHRMIDEVLSAIEGSVHRQVILEAKIIEVELRDGFRSGINWSALGTINGNPIGFGQVAGQGLFQEGTAATRGSPLDISPGQVRTGADSSTFGGPAFLTFDASDFNAFIELLESQGNTRVLSSPRVSTVNNQKAVIKVGTDEFFVTGVTSRTAAGGVGSTAASTVQLTPFFSGIALDVTPQISGNGEIILHINPTVSEVSDQQKSFTVGGREESLPLAFSSVRQSDSVIRAGSGQLVVIGGLMKDSSQENRIGTPLLGGLPLVGHLFSSRQQRTTKTELVILLRPTVVDSAGDQSIHARQTRDRIRAMDRHR